MRKATVSKITINTARLIATVSAFAFAGSALAAGEATSDFYRSLVPGQRAQQLPEQCYDELGNLVITPQNVELCSALPTAAIGVPGVPGRDNEGERGSGPSGGPPDDPGGPPDDPGGGDPPEDPGGPPDGKGNNGHGNNEDGVDSSNPGKSGKHDDDSSAPDDDEVGHGKGPKN